MWDVPVVTDRTKLSNRSVRVLHDKKDNTGLVIAVAIPDDLNANIKETEKLSKCKDLETEVSRLWK